MRRKFLVDTDVASDDAVALLMALRSPEVEVVGITTVAGNVEVRQASRNALYTAELCGSSVPVFTGAEKPLRRAHQNAEWFHGRDGLGDHGYPAPEREPEKKKATEAILELIEAHPGLVLVTLGPLTNIALAEAAGNRREGKPVRDDGRSAVLRGKCDAGGGVQHLVRSGSGANRCGKWLAGGDGGLAFVPWRSGVKCRGDRESAGLRYAGGKVCD